MKRISLALVVLALTVLVSAIPGADAGTISWRNIDGYQALDMDTALSAAQSGKRFVCGKMPERPNTAGEFSVNFSADYSIGAFAGTTGYETDYLWQEGIGFGVPEQVFMPVSQATYDYQWYFRGVAGTSQFQYLRLCVMKFRYTPWGSELKSSYWGPPRQPTRGELLLSPYLPDIPNGYQVIGAMQALMLVEK